VCKVIKKEGGFQKNEVEVDGRRELRKKKRVIR
jgi:hypothetical protein